MSVENSNKINAKIDWIIFLSIILLMFIGTAIVYSASSTISELKFGSTETLMLSHFIKILVGVILILLFSSIDYHIYKKISKLLLFFSVILLLFVLVGGDSAKGAVRWISLGPLSFQPSEVAKFALIIHFANLLTLKQDRIKEFEGSFVPLISWLLVLCILIAMQPNYSTMIVISLIGFSMMFIGNINLLYLAGSAFIGFIFLGLFAFAAPYRIARIQSYLSNPLESAGAESYQLKQALIAIGNGGIFGVGTGQSRQSHMFLPESYGDFIFSIIAEEYGFFGVILVITIFSIILIRAYKIALNSPDNFGYFLSIGIILTFGFYFFINIGVNIGLLPTTGLPLPFVSFGGSAILIYSIAIGILLNISKQSGVFKRA